VCYPYHLVLFSFDLLVNAVAMRVILDKIKTVAARYDADGTPLECMDGTRVDLLKDLKDRATGEVEPEKRIIAVCGFPGSGKSTIAKSLAVRLVKEGYLASSFFFS